jgi:hypothetical protein
MLLLYFFIPTRNLALRDLGLLFTSSADGSIGFLFINTKGDSCLVP